MDTYLKLLEGFFFIKKARTRGNATQRESWVGGDLHPQPSARSFPAVLPPCNVLRKRLTSPSSCDHCGALALPVFLPHSENLLSPQYLQASSSLHFAGDWPRWLHCLLNVAAQRLPTKMKAAAVKQPSACPFGAKPFF